MDFYGLSSSGGLEYGISVDLRYNSAAYYIVSLPSGDILTAGLAKFDIAGANPQKAIVDALNSAVLASCNDYAIDEDEITAYSVCGTIENLHIFSGIEENNSLFGIEDRAQKIGLCGRKNASVFILPCAENGISGNMLSTLCYFGADTAPENSLFIDFGEYTQCVLKTKSGFLSGKVSSYAFETKGISCGTSSESGAIHTAEIKPDGEIKYSTMHNVVASGISATGLVDVVAVNLEKGFISDDGRIKDGKITLLDGKELLQSDIDLFYESASAVNSLISSLCEDIIPSVYISGCYGSQFHSENLIKTGVLPKCLSEADITVVANGSGLGMIKELKNDDERDRMISLSEKLV